MYITIKTIGRSFVTDPDRWLGKSRYFENLFSGNWGDKQEDDSYFVETDPDVFEHILRYLRTGVLPVFYDLAKGHDFALYHSLLQEANYFDIARLQKWLCEKTYLEVVKIHHVATETEKPTRPGKMIDMTVRGDMDVSIVPIIQRQSHYYCPYKSHEDGTTPCCPNRAREDRIEVKDNWRDQDHLKWCIVQKEIKFNHNLCINAYPDEDT